MLNLEEKRISRHKRVRRRVIGTKEKPRLSVHRSLKHFYAQLIDDLEQKTLLSYSSLNPSLKKKEGGKNTLQLIEELGKQFATEAKSKGFTKVVFDRGGFPYHGRIKAFADACRKSGLTF